MSICDRCTDQHIITTVSLLKAFQSTCTKLAASLRERDRADRDPGDIRHADDIEQLAVDAAGCVRMWEDIRNA